MRINVAVYKNHNRSCPIIEEGGDGNEVGTCWFPAPNGKCPRHGYWALNVDKVPEVNEMHWAMTVRLQSLLQDEEEKHNEIGLLSKNMFSRIKNRKEINRIKLNIAFTNFGIENALAYFELHDYNGNRLK